jgi:predicted GNAT family N-acyltransferase
MDIRGKCTHALTKKNLALVTKVLEIMQSGSLKIHELNRNQSYSAYCASRENALSKYNAKVAKANQKLRYGDEIVEVKLPYQDLHDILKRNNSTKVFRVPEKQSGLKRNRDEDKKVDKVTEIISNLPEPKGNQFTMREMILALDGNEHKLIRSVILELQKRGKAVFGKTSFETKMKRYQEEGILPEDSYLGGKNGRPTVTNNIVGINDCEIKNQSFVAGNDNARVMEYLEQEMKKKMENQGYATSVGIPTISRRTLYNYKKAGNALDGRVSGGIQNKNVRKKNKSREIASRSKRNAAGMIGVYGATSMVPGDPSVPEDLSPGARIFYSAVKKAFKSSVKPTD